MRRNPIICRTIKRDGNKSTFTLNGKQSNRSQVLKFAQSFSIQIDNLCQFLPQDKVSEFAALTPVELLHSTQRAAAGPEMLEWHENLKALGSEQKKLQTDNSGDKDLLANLQNRQDAQRNDVEKVREKAQVKRKIEILESFRPIAAYREHTQQFRLVREEKDRLEQELKELKAALEPSMQSVNAKAEYFSQIETVSKYKRRQLDRADSAAKDIAGKIDQHERSIKDLSAQVEAEKKSGQSSRQESNKISQNLNRLRRQLEEEPAEFDVDYYNEKIVSAAMVMRVVLTCTAGEAPRVERGRGQGR